MDRGPQYARLFDALDDILHYHDCDRWEDAADELIYWAERHSEDEQLREFSNWLSRLDVE